VVQILLLVARIVGFAEIGQPPHAPWIGDTIDDHMAEVRKCYHAALARDASYAGMIVLTLDVHGGKATRAVAESFDKEMDGCLVHAIAKWEFDASIDTKGYVKHIQLGPPRTSAAVETKTFAALVKYAKDLRQCTKANAVTLAIDVNASGRVMIVKVFDVDDEAAACVVDSSGKWKVQGGDKTYRMKGTIKIRK
jgi:hypothetical protein